MKKLINHLKANWIRHGFETLVVVVGVLIAFTLNNWNENRKDLKYKEQLVNNLVVELYTAKAELATSIERAEKVVYHGHLFLEIVRTNNRIIPVDSIKTLARWSKSKILYKLSLSSYEESKSSGRLSLIDNKDILKTYSEVFAALEDYHHHFPIAAQVYYTGSVWDFRKKYGSLSVLDSRFEDVPPPFRISDEEYHEMIREPITHAVVENFNTLSVAILGSLHNMDTAIDKLIKMLEEFDDSIKN